MLAWSDGTDQKIQQLYKRLGSNWKLIAKQIPNKTPQQVRDRYNTIMKQSERTQNPEEQGIEKQDSEQLGREKEVLVKTK